MTRQQIFDKVWFHFVIMRRGFGYDKVKKVCLYRTKGGARCGIGCLIPKKLYSKDMDNVDGNDMS